MKGIKVDKSDKFFSWYIRGRDKQCVRCHSPITYNHRGKPNNHTNSHFFGRAKESTRFDPLNCDTLCFGCHRIWGSDDREAYRDFKIKQLGQKEFDRLTLRANTYQKKDRAMSLLYVKELLKSLEEQV